jgi:hypothetical protein
VLELDARESEIEERSSKRSESALAGGGWRILEATDGDRGAVAESREARQGEGGHRRISIHAEETGRVARPLQDRQGGIALADRSVQVASSGTSNEGRHDLLDEDRNVKRFSRCRA